MRKLINGAIGALLTVSSVNAAGGDISYGYISNGADWPLIKAEKYQCDSTNQSPIDLRTEMNKAPFQQGNGREFIANYKNIENAEVKNLGMTI